MARLAKETGVFPVFEAEYGEIKSALPIRRPLPVEDYLRPQKRYAHLFGKNPAVATIARIQALADKNIRKYGLLEKEAR
jgi:pyruvate ferredoxin oxidoreductase beta subunit